VLAEALVRHAGFPADQVVLLATDQPLERQPTRVNLLRRLSNLVAAVPKDVTNESELWRKSGGKPTFPT